MTAEQSPTPKARRLCLLGAVLLALGIWHVYVPQAYQATKGDSPSVLRLLWICLNVFTVFGTGLAALVLFWVATTDAELKEKKPR